VRDEENLDRVDVVVRGLRPGDLSTGPMVVGMAGSARIGTGMVSSVLARTSSVPPVDFAMDTRSSD